MNLNDRYFELCYTKRIHEFAKIAQYKNWTIEKARTEYKSLDEFYQKELKISQDKLNQLRVDFNKFNDLYTRYYKESRKELFENSQDFMEWYDKQRESCNYCGITQSELHRIVKLRKGNLTLNDLTKRSKGTLEIEKLNPEQGYTFENSVLACPFCNNAKSNLIKEDDWRIFFVPAMKNYFSSILHDDRR
jgi:5-methylcytosine-specific restriction endonuclease McrA